MDEQTRRAKVTHEAAIRMARAGLTAKSATVRMTAAARLSELEAEYTAKYGA